MMQGLLATGPQQTIKQFMEYWLEDVHKPTIKLSSYTNYRGILNNHILPALGHIRIQKLTVQQVESFYASKVKEGKSAKTIKVIHRVLRKAGLPPMRFHNLRHSAATLLLAMGVHPKVVQELLGHSNIAITLNVYSHVLQEIRGTQDEQ